MEKALHHLKAALNAFSKYPVFNPSPNQYFQLRV